MTKAIDISGKTFGNWVVIDRDLDHKRKRDAYWNCLCKCGTKLSIRGSDLRGHRSTQCVSCARKQNIIIAQDHKWKEKIDHKLMIGRKFFRWTVIALVPIKGSGVRYKCQCRCGTERVIERRSLINLLTSGCLTCHNRLQ